MKTSTRTELAKLYNVNYETFKKWLIKVPGLVIDKKQRTLTPKQVSIIIEHLGEP